MDFAHYEGEPESGRELKTLIDAMTLFKKSVQAFTASVDKLDASLAASMVVAENLMARYEWMEQQKARS